MDAILQIFLGRFWVSNIFQLNLLILKIVILSLIEVLWDGVRPFSHSTTQAKIYSCEPSHFRIKKETGLWTDVDMDCWVWTCFSLAVWCNSSGENRTSSNTQHGCSRIRRGNLSRRATGMFLITPSENISFQRRKNLRFQMKMFSIIGLVELLWG